MNFVCPDWSVPTNIKAISTVRQGGFSSGVFSGLNLGFHVGDNEKLVKKNHQRLESELGLSHSPVWLNQVHSTELVIADKHLSNDPFSVKPTADGSITNKQYIACAIMTADCLPLLLTNKQGSQVAAVHAGWRGLANGIIEKTIRSFDCSPMDIIAWSGPCIGPNAFEIGGEVREQLGGSDSCYALTANGEKYLANLTALTGERLSKLGVMNYTYNDQCTYNNAEFFYSFRRDGQCGRMASLIWME